MRFLMFVLFMSLASATSAQDFKNSNWVANGQSIKNASQFTIDAKNDFYRILTYQDMYDKPLSFFGVNYRSAPGSFILDDGTIVQDNLNRILITMGLRLGERAFFGIVADAIENGQLREDYAKSFSSNVSQALVYGGYKLGPIQASVAWQNSPGQSGLNIREELVNELSGASDQRSVEHPDQNKMIYSIYAKPGIYVSYSEFNIRSLNPITNVTTEGPQQSELQVIIQSPKRFLPDWAGLPFIVVDRFTNVQFLDESSSESETVFGLLVRMIFTHLKFWKG